ncbi:hypothetical protein BHE74_00018976, partial [Ensete ventricosum]
KAARSRGGQPRPAPMQGRPPTARPATAKAPCRGSRQHARSLASMAGACRGRAYGHRQRPRLGRRGQLPDVRPQGVALRPGLPPARAAALAGAAAPAAGPAAHANDMQHQCLRRATTTTVVAQ